MITPYGCSRSITDLGHGVKHVDCDFGGAYFITNALAKRTIPRRHLDVASAKMGNYWFFDEQDAWAILALHIPDPFKAAGAATFAKSLSKFDY